MKYPINLGKKDFPTSVSDLTLSLQASASMLLSPESPVLRDSEHLKELLCCGDIWVFQAPELKFNIRVVSADDLHHSLNHFVSQLGESTCRAKVWTDLELVVLYKSCIFEPGPGCSTYVLSFGIQKRLGHPGKKKALKLPKILRDSSDAIPPTNIPTARMTSIDVHLEYTHTHRQCIKRIQQQEPNDQNDDIIQSTEFDDWDWDRAQYLQKSISTIADTHVSIFEHDFRGIDEESEHFNHLTPVSSNHLEMATLFREALTVLVFGNVVGGRKNSQTGMSSFQSLSKIAPGVFKPGYREGMNQRSRLMSSIAKSLTSMLNLSDNHALKEKMASITAVLQPGVRPSNSSTICNDTKAILKMRLWDIAQKRLYHVPTPKSLRASSSLCVPNQDEQAQDETLFSEAISGGPEYLDDNCNAIEYGLDFYPESNEFEPEFDLDFNFDESEHSSNMIFDDNYIEHSAEILEVQHFNSQKTNPRPAFMEADCQATSSYTRTLSLRHPEVTDTDHEGMLDFDSNFAEDFPAISSQTSFSHSPHLYSGPLLGLREDYDEDEMLCDDSST